MNHAADPAAQRQDAIMTNTESMRVGRAANGMTYRGQTIGSGYDCEVRRTGDRSALACVTEVSSGREWMASFDDLDDMDLQALACRLASNPELSDGCWSSDDPDTGDDGWDELVVIWNAAKVGGAS